MIISVANELSSLKLSVSRSRSTVQVRPKDGPQEAASVQRLSDHGEGRELAEEKPHAGAFQRHRLIRSCRERLHRQRLSLLGGAAWSVHVVRNSPAHECYISLGKPKYLSFGSLNLGCYASAHTCNRSDSTRRAYTLERIPLVSWLWNKPFNEGKTSTVFPTSPS